MAAMSDYLENKLIDHIFRGTPFTANGTLFVGLTTSLPSDANTGSNVVEPPSANGYARVPVSSNLNNWLSTQITIGSVSSGTSGNTMNYYTIQFPSPTGNWGVINGFGIFDKDTAGNTYFSGALTTPKTINNGDAAPSFAANTLIIQIDN